MYYNVYVLFIFYSLFFYGTVFIISFFNIYFSYSLNDSNDNYSTYFKSNQTIIESYNLDFVTNQPYLTNIQFSNNSLEYNNTYGYTGEKVRICFIGSCYTKRDQISKNCSEVCSISGSTCEAYNQKCTYIYCQRTDYEYENGVCHDYNEIKSWRGQKMKLKTELFPFYQIKDVVTENNTCRQGYKQCGYINKEKDKLCVNNRVNCPINKVVIKDENIAPTDFYYETGKIGDKYLFYTNQNTNNFLYINIIVDSGINSTNYTEIIDNQSLTDFFNENPYTYDGNFTSKSAEELSEYGDAKLKMIENINQTSLKELKKLQEKYTEHQTLYTEEKIKEMNENVPKYISLLHKYNKITIAYCFIGPIILIALLYLLENKCDCDLNGKKICIVVFLVSSPFIYFISYNFIHVILNKITYEQYYSMNYLKEYIFCIDISTYTCFFDKINHYNNSLFICYIIETVIIILYIISFFIVYYKDRDNSGQKTGNSRQTTDNSDRIKRRMIDEETRKADCQNLLIG